MLFCVFSLSSEEAKHSNYGSMELVTPGEQPCTELKKRAWSARLFALVLSGFRHRAGGEVSRHLHSGRPFQGHGHSLFSDHNPEEGKSALVSDLWLLVGLEEHPSPLCINKIRCNEMRHLPSSPVSYLTRQEVIRHLPSFSEAQKWLT